MKCKCGKEIPEERVKLGFNICVSCSKVERYGCVPIYNGKTGNTVEIMKDSKKAIVMNNMQLRNRFGPCLGMHPARRNKENDQPLSPTGEKE